MTDMLWSYSRLDAVVGGKLVYRSWERKRLCRSMMVSMKRSYFFSYHEDCRDDEKLKEVEEAVVTELFDWDEAA